MVSLVIKLFTLSILLTLSIHSEEPKPKQDKFDGIISTKDKRLAELTEKDRGKVSERLFFRGKENDYLVFYDLDGNESLFRYRRDKFDLDAEEKVKGLFSGHEYLVKGEFQGILSFYDSIKKIYLNPPVFLTLAEILEQEKKEKEAQEKFEKERLEKEKALGISPKESNDKKEEKIKALYNPKFRKPVFKFISFESLIPEQIIH
ncbi:MAG: hypothetical protein SFU98_05400 [Leptospiraceae bacterium]|nr:hypothetical protein [Leptospiraceae bacterium]